MLSKILENVPQNSEIIMTENYIRKIKSVTFLTLEMISTETKFLIKGHYFAGKRFPWYCKTRVTSCEVKT